MLWDRVDTWHTARLGSGCVRIGPTLGSMSYVQTFLGVLKIIGWFRDRRLIQRSSADRAQHRQQCDLSTVLLSSVVWLLTCRYVVIASTRTCIALHCDVCQCSPLSDRLIVSCCASFMMWRVRVDSTRNLCHKVSAMIYYAGPTRPHSQSTCSLH